MGNTKWQLRWVHLRKHGDRDKTWQIVWWWHQFSSIFKLFWHPYPATTSSGSENTKLREPSSSLGPGSCRVNRSEKLVEKICNIIVETKWNKISWLKNIFYQSGSGSARPISHFSRTRSPQAQGPCWAQKSTSNLICTVKRNIYEIVSTTRLYTRGNVAGFKLILLFWCWYDVHRKQVLTQWAVFAVSTHSFSTFKQNIGFIDLVRQSATMVWVTIHSNRSPPSLSKEVYLRNLQYYEQDRRVK